MSKKKNQHIWTELFLLWNIPFWYYLQNVFWEISEQEGNLSLLETVHYIRVTGQLFSNPCGSELYLVTPANRKCGDESSHLNWNGTTGVTETIQNEKILCLSAKIMHYSLRLDRFPYIFLYIILYTHAYPNIILVTELILDEDIKVLVTHTSFHLKVFFCFFVF